MLKINSIALLTAIGSILTVGVSEAEAATYTVTKTTDFIPANSTDPDYIGTLRWAIEQAENNPGADTIDINVGGGTIDVNIQDPSISPVTVNGACRSGYTPAAAFKITHSLTINGNGAIIDGGRTGNSGSLSGRRIFYVPNDSSGNINLNNLTLQNGNAAIIRSR